MLINPSNPHFYVDRNEGFFDIINVLLQRFPKSSHNLSNLHFICQRLHVKNIEEF